jgi:hypothetical protein
MSRRIQISLLQRNVHAVAELLERDAPKTCEAIWKALPLEGPAFHAKRAHNEVYTLVSPFAAPSVGPEYATIFPTARDVVYFFFPPERVSNYIRGYDKYLPKELWAEAPERGIVDLAIFYGRNNFLFNFMGPNPGNVFATITDGFEAMAAACQDVWYAGAKGERLRFARYEP